MIGSNIEVKLKVADEISLLEAPLFLSNLESCNWIKTFQHDRSISFKLATNIIEHDPSMILYLYSNDEFVMDSLYRYAFTKEPNLILHYYIEDYDLILKNQIQIKSKSRKIEPDAHLMNQYLAISFSLNPNILIEFPTIDGTIFDLWEPNLSNMTEITDSLLDVIPKNIFSKLLVKHHHAIYAMPLFDYAFRKKYTIPEKCYETLFKISPFSILDGKFSNKWWKYSLLQIRKNNTLCNPASNDNDSIIEFCAKCIEKLKNEDDDTSCLLDYIRLSILDGKKSSINYRLTILKNLGYEITPQLFGYPKLNYDFGARISKIPITYFAKMVFDEIKHFGDEFKHMQSFFDLPVPPNDDIVNSIHTYCMNSGHDRKKLFHIVYDLFNYSNERIIYENKNENENEKSID